MINKIKNFFTGNVNTKTVKKDIGADEHDVYIPVSGRSFSYRETDNTIAICAKILAESMATVSYGLYDLSNKRQNDEMYRVALSVKPNKYQNSVEFWKLIEKNRVIHGNAYAYIDWAPSGEVKNLVPLDPVYMRAYINNTETWLDADLVYEYQDSTRGKTYTFLPDELLHFKANSNNGIMGVPAYDSLYEIVRGNNIASGYIDEIYKNGYAGVMTLSYTSDLSVAKRKELVTQIKEVLNHQGSRMLAIPVGMEAKVQGGNGIDGKTYVDLRNEGVKRIAAFMGIPLFMLGLGDSAGSNAMTSAQKSAFYNTTLKPIINQYACELTSKLLTYKDVRKGIHFDNDDISGFGLLTADERVKVLTQLAAAGILTVNECRDDIGYDRYVDETNSGDKLYRNGAFTSADNGNSIGSKNEKVTVDHSQVAN
jgi:HK97 family phage portal protein